MYTPLVSHYIHDWVDGGKLFVEIVRSPGLEPVVVGVKSPMLYRLSYHAHQASKRPQFDACIESTSK